MTIALAIDHPVALRGSGALRPYYSRSTCGGFNVWGQVPPPTAAGLTGSGGKPGEAAWRHYHVRRVAYTTDAVTVAMTQPTPSLFAARRRRDHRIRAHPGPLLRRVRL